MSIKGSSTLSVISRILLCIESTTLHQVWGTSKCPIGINSDSEPDSTETIFFERGFLGKTLITSNTTIIIP